MVGWHHRLSVNELNRLWEIMKDGESCSAAVRGVTKGLHDLVTEQQQQYFKSNQKTGD